MPDEVPLYDPTTVIGEEVVQGIQDVLASGWLTLGPKTEKFEEKFSDHHGTQHGVAVNACTSALYACLRSLGIGPSDKVIVPAMTFSATANVVRLLEGEVLLCDVKENGNIDPDSLRNLLETYNDVAAVIPVHLYGLPCDMPEIIEIADEYDIAVIEDCAHSPGATIENQPVGSFGDAGCFSFYATKNMTTGEGGMVVTDNSNLAEKIRKLRNHHQTKSPDEKKRNWGYDVDGLGFNFRMSEIQASIGLDQLKKLNELNSARRTVARRYISEIEDIEGLNWKGGSEYKDHVFHLFVIQVGSGYPLSRNELYDVLSQNSIVTGVHYPSISNLTYYTDTRGESTNAEQLSEKILSIPMYPGMNPNVQERVTNLLKSPKE